MSVLCPLLIVTVLIKSKLLLTSLNLCVLDDYTLGFEKLQTSSFPSHFMGKTLYHKRQHLIFNRIII